MGHFSIFARTTFAWFTSKDEVTNRLSASAEYGVAIAENFQPPETWVPGQQINKDAGAVNTGNVDAFVRMQLSGKMRLLQQNRLAADATSGMKAGYVAGSAGNSSSFNNPTTAVTDTDLLKAGITLMDGNGNYYKTLSTTQAANPTLTLGSSHAGFTGTTSTALSEVQAMQSGILAYAPTDAEYTYILNEPTTLTIKVATIDGIGTTSGTNDYQTVEVPAGTLVHVGGTAGTGVAYTTGASSTLTIPTATYTDIMGNTGTAIATVYVQAQTHDDSSTFFVPQNVEYETFVPITDGLYLFLRDENDANQADSEFSGYYKKTQDITNNENAALSKTGETVYYALNTDTQRANRSEYAVKGAITATYAAPVAVTYDGTGTNAKNIRHIVPDTKLELFTAQYANVDASKLKFYAGDVASNKQTLYAVYDKDGSDNDFTAADDVVVEINLANINTTPEGWSEKGLSDVTGYDLDGTTLTKDATKLTFYYNNDLEAGDTTAKLVDNVKLYQGVTNKAYLAFDFDLNVALESVQVTFGEDGTEAATALSEWTSDNGNWTGATGSATMGTGDAAKEIASVSWS